MQDKKKIILIIISAFLIIVLSSYAHSELNNGLVDYWTFNNITPISSTFNKVNWTATNVLSSTNGKINNSINISSSSTMYNDNIGSGNRYINREFSISLWINVSNYPPVFNTTVILTNHYSGVNNQGSFIFTISPSNGVSVSGGVYNVGWVGNILITPTNIFNNNFTHIVFTSKDYEHKLYINGILVSTNTTYSAFNRTARWAMFTEMDSGGGVNYYYGRPGNFSYIDEMGIWNRTLTQTEVTELYGGGLGTTYPFPGLYFGGITPMNNSFINNNWVFINVTSNSNIYNCTLNWNNTILNMTNITNYAFRNVTSINNGSYYYFANCTINAVSYITETRIITIDTTPPTITFNTNSDNGTYNRGYIFINYTITDTNYNTSTIRIFNTTSLIFNLTTTNNTQTINITNLANGQYYYNITATDLAGNTNTSNTINITLNTSINITNPLNNQIQSTRYLNITWKPPPSINVSNYTVILNNKNFTVGLNTSYNMDLYAENLTIGQHNITIIATSTIGNTYNATRIINLTRNTEVYLYVKYNNGTNILNITNYTLHEYTQGTNTTTIIEPLLINLIRNNTYYFMINDTAGLYAYNYFNYTTNNFTNNLTIFMLPTNSINITIRDEYLYNIITQNTTVRFEKIGSAISYIYTTTNGQLLPFNLEQGNYTVTFTSTSPIVYNVKYYIIEIINRASTTLTAYLNNGGVTLLNYKDSSGSPLNNVDVQIKRTVNGSYVTVESLKTQIDGRTQFNYIPNTRYVIVSTLEGYENLTFELNPVLFSSYDITMRLLDSDIVEPTAYGAFSKSSYIKGNYGILTFKIISPSCSLINYSIKTYVNGISNYSGYNNNPCTDIFYIPYDFRNITTNTTYTTIYEYFLNNGANQTIRNDYVVVLPLTNRTLLNLSENTFGFGIGDRILIVVFINLIVFGVGFLVSGLILGSILSIINTLIFVSNGFIPAQVFYATIVILILLIIGKGVTDG